MPKKTCDITSVNPNYCFWWDMPVVFYTKQHNLWQTDMYLSSVAEIKS